MSNAICEQQKPQIRLHSLISALLFPALIVTGISYHFILYMILYVFLVYFGNVFFFLLTCKVNSHEKSSYLPILSPVLVICY